MNRVRVTRVVRGMVATAVADPRGGARLAIAEPIARFLAIGVASTLAYAVLFLALAGAVGSAGASAAALAITAVANTAANRRLTFGVRGRAGLARQHVAGFVVFLIALVLTNGALSVLHAVEPHPARLLEAVVLVVANLIATVTRYCVLATWVFKTRRIQGHRATAVPAPTQGT
jgi:putative flippase GtrA